MEQTSLYLRRPLQDKEWVKKIGLGGLIGLIPIFNLSLLGYLLEWILSSSEEDAVLPEWNEWGKLFANGLIVFLIIIAYCFLPFIFLWLGRGVAGLGGMAIVVGYLLKFLAGLGFGLVSFILPVVLIQFAHREKIEEAFQMKLIGEMIVSVLPEYIFSYLFSLGLVTLSWIIIAILSPIFLGYILAPILNFYIGLVILYRFSKTLTKRVST